MKRNQLFIIIILFLFSISLIADGPHYVSIPVYTEAGGKPLSLLFEATLFQWTVTSAQGVTPVTHGWVQSGPQVIAGTDVTVTEDNFNCSYNTGGSVGRILIQIGTIDLGWNPGDSLFVTATYVEDPVQTGKSSFLMGSIDGVDFEQLPVTQGMQLLAQTVIDDWGETDDGTADLTYGSFALTRTTSGSSVDVDVSVAAPATLFESLPDASARLVRIDQCFSVEFEEDVTQVAVDFTWTSNALVINMSAEDLLVSPDGINWIYSDNNAAGVTLDPTTPWTSDTSKMTVSFTTTKKHALYAVSDGNATYNPGVTVPNIPSGKSAVVSGTTPTLTISCNPVAIPGASYQLYTAADNNLSAVGTVFKGSGAYTPSKGIDYSVASDALKFYGLKVYNGTTDYQCDLGNWRYVFHNDYGFSTDVSKSKTNLVPLPFTDMENGFTTASTLMDELSSCDAIVKFDASNQDYTYYTKYTKNEVTYYLGDNFDIQSDGIYFASIGDGVSSPTFHGTLDNDDFTLYEGLNIIYVPVPTTLTYAAGIVASIEALDTNGYITCTKVQQWDAATQLWVSYSFVDASWTGTNFTLSGSGLNPVFVTIEIAVAGDASYSYGK